MLRDFLILCSVLSVLLLISNVCGNKHTVYFSFIHRGAVWVIGDGQIGIQMWCTVHASIYRRPLKRIYDLCEVMAPVPVTYFHFCMPRVWKCRYACIWSKYLLNVNYLLTVGHRTSADWLTSCSYAVPGVHFVVYRADFPIAVIVSFNYECFLLDKISVWYLSV